jgi:hypothetical protein
MSKRERLEEKLHNVAVELIDMEDMNVFKKLGFKKYYKRLEKLNNKFHKLELELALIK